MEVNLLLYLIFTCFVGGYAFVFGFLRKINEWLYVRKLGEKQYYLPPGDMGWPFLGKMLSFLKAFKFRDPDSFISSFVTRYGGMGMYRTVMFGKPCIIVSTPETCRRVLADEVNFKFSYPKTTQELIGKKSFHNMSNAEHKHFRRLTAAKINGSESLSMYIKHIEEIMIGSLEEWTKMDCPIEFYEEMKKATFKVILPIFLGSVTDDSFISRTISLFGEINKGFNTLAINLPGFQFHRAIKAKKELEKIIKEVVDTRKSMKKNNAYIASKSMLDLLMEAEDENGQALSEDMIIDILHMYLVAGFDNVALATLWMVLYFSESPDTLQKAKEEQIQILKSREPTQKGLTYQEIKQMEYLAKVTDEMLRRVNFGFSLFREAKEDTTISGYLIPKGWNVLVFLRGVHMDPANYSEPEEFNPSRWDNYKKKGGAFIPFGAGSRFCPGSDLVKLEMSIFLHYFLLNYEVERTNPKCPINYFPSPKPSDNFMAKFKRLCSDSMDV
ncbi:ent-kaurenoic acid oxidase 2-like [Rhodamnia argentea]|uniref:Ent-kaurenoic acid oxidase 2-like n=1 Tax=Rhodamnia argentea TaxID=178133 RepID=A0A8B8NPZ1_9MYRT|nr:ent-kaurenoic acid oxidase 2-like [Rhodamnia argentea]